MVECGHERKEQSPSGRIRGGALGSGRNFSLSSGKPTFHRVSFRDSHGDHA